MSVLHAKRHIIIIGNIVSCILNNNRWAWMCCVIKHIQSMIAIEAIALAIRNYTLFIHFVQLFPLLFLAILLAFSSCSSLNSITTMQAHAGDVSRVSCSLHADRDKKQCDSHVAVRFTSIRTFKSITITKHSMQNKKKNIQGKQAKKCRWLFKFPVCCYISIFLVTTNSIVWHSAIVHRNLYSEPLWNELIRPPPDYMVWLRTT